MNSLLLIGGPPGSGKTTLGDHLRLRLADRGGCLHISVGDLLRSIASGDRSSQFAALLGGSDSPLTRAEPMPIGLVHSVVLEALEEACEDHNLAILSGYPRYRSQAQLGRDLVDRFETSFVILIECDYAEASTRLLGRPHRQGEDAADAHRFDIRWQEYVSQTKPVLESLAPRVTSAAHLDASKSPAELAREAETFLRSASARSSCVNGAGCERRA